MQTVETTFKISFTPEQYQQAVSYVEDMKKHKNRMFWRGKEGMSDEQLVYSHLAHRILSGFYNRYSPTSSRQIIEMTSSGHANNN